MHPGALVGKMEALQQMSQLQPQQQQQPQQTQPAGAHSSMSTFATPMFGSSSISRDNSTSNRMAPRRMARTPFRRTRNKLKLKQKSRISSFIPESSLHEYARWVEDRGSERTEQEQKFLWKYQKRRLIQQDKLSTETLKDYVSRLLQKEERTDAENRLVRQYHRRARRKLKDGNEETQLVVWKRVRPNRAVGVAQSASTTNNALTVQMASLKESMDKMGLSAQKLRDAKMD
ncbi:unnamed protein product [Cylindrotheca closterium]|uniref:Uncharacterized protein n=1 Tax=Cylindrotheca closterium TaxID=2856 RepID=A0AAD2PWS3_9STRA|nr:unnamed protein product [Cylindrotheca closterium]